MTALILCQVRIADLFSEKLEVLFLAALGCRVHRAALS